MPTCCERSYARANTSRARSTYPWLSISIITRRSFSPAIFTIGSKFAQHASTETSRPSWVSFTEIAASTSSASAPASSADRYASRAASACCGVSTCSPRWSSIVRSPRECSSRAAAIASAKVSPATNRKATRRPGRVPVTARRAHGWLATRRIAGRNTLVERPTTAVYARAPSRRPSARRSARHRVEDVPVLGAVAGLAVVLLLLEPLERPSIEESSRLGLRERADVIVRRPRVAFAEQLPREAAAGNDRAADPGPHVGEPGRVAEEQAEARPDEVGRRELNVFHRRDERPQARLQLGRDPVAGSLDRLVLGVRREHPPPPLEHRERVDARPASEVDRLARALEGTEHLQQEGARLPAFVLSVVVGPGDLVAHTGASLAAIPPRRISTNSLIRMLRRSGRRWINPGSRSSDTNASWNRCAAQSSIDAIISGSTSSRISPCRTPNSTNSKVPYGSSLRMNRSIGPRSPSSVSYRPIIASRFGTGSEPTDSSVLWSHQSSVSQKPPRTTSSGASSHAGSIWTAC